MMTQDEIFKKILEDQFITTAVLDMSRVFKSVDDMRHAFAPYFRLCSTLADLINCMDLCGEHSHPEAAGIGKLIPFVSIGVPGMHAPFVDDWAAAYLTSTGVDPMFFTEESQKAKDLGEAGTPNYMHGLLVISAVGDVMVNLAGTSLLVASALKLDGEMSQ